MFAEIFHFYWTESAKAGVKGYFCKTDTFYFEAFDQFPAKVKTSCGGGNSTFMFGINGLVAFLVFLIGFAFDVFRKGSFTQLFQLLTESLFISFPEETDGTAAAGSIIDHFCYQVFLV